MEKLAHESLINGKIWTSKYFDDFGIFELVLR
jgi:hypothetical protein